MTEEPLKGQMNPLFLDANGEPPIRDMHFGKDVLSVEFFCSKVTFNFSNLPFQVRPVFQTVMLRVERKEFFIYQKIQVAFFGVLSRFTNAGPNS